MPREKNSKETVIADYFRDEPLDKAMVLYGIVRDIMRGRQGPQLRKSPKPPRRKVAPTMAVGGSLEA